MSAQVEVNNQIIAKFLCTEQRNAFKGGNICINSMGSNANSKLI